MGKITFYRKRKHKFYSSNKEVKKRGSGSAGRVLVGFYTDEEGRVRPTT